MTTDSFAAGGAWLYLAGQAIRQINFWVPQTGSIALGISIFSYAGEVVVSVIASAQIIPDPETIVEGFEAEFAVLQALMPCCRSS